MIQNEKIKILVVDDEVDLANIIGAHLMMAGYEHQVVHSAQAAISCLEKEKFDLVICDLIMPEMDGLEFFQEIRRRGINLPFIFCSGLDESSYKDAYPEGVIGFMLKPFSMSDLMLTISKFLLPG